MPNNPEPTPKIFISYAWENQTIAKRLQSELQRDGVEVFVDYEKITGGDSLPQRISTALDWCNTLILLWSADSAESYYVKQEWSSAFHLQKKIIACVLDGTKLPALLSGNLYLSFKSYETGYAELCRSLGVQLKLPAAKAAPPQPPKSKLPPQQAEMRVPRPPEEKRESPPSAPTKRKSFAETLHRKLKPPDPAPVLKPPEVFDEAENDDAAATATPSRWSRRKIVSVIIGIIAVSFLIGKMIYKEPTSPISTPTKPEQISPSQTVRRFRDKPATLSEAEVKTMLQRHDFFCKDYNWNKAFSNPSGSGFANQFVGQANGKIIFDHASGLTWQRAGSDDSMTFADAEYYIRDLNGKNFAGYNDWRLPTLEEAMSLVEREENNTGLYINSLFDETQTWIWTSDTYSAVLAWVVGCYDGNCNHGPVTLKGFVRVVR